MKNSLLLFSALLFFCINFAEAQPSLPDSSHVLVVYNINSGLSDSVKSYYQQSRSIPNSNIVGLDSLFNEWITDPETQEPHFIELQQQGESMVDVQNEGSACATKHAWIYFNKRIAIPIAAYLNETYVNGTKLKDIIRFIVLCKGIPFKIYSRWENYPYSGNKNVVVDQLLCFLGETIDNHDALLDYFIPGCNDQGAEIENPYYDSDPNFSMDKKFIPNHYKKNIYFNQQLKELTLSYLVSHLSAPFYENITSMIDKSIAAINSQDYDWFIDAHPNPIFGGNYLMGQAAQTESKFIALGINNYFFDTTPSNITEHNKPIMSYSSHGVHQYWPEDYILTKLNNFTLADGSIFNTAESFNGYTVGTWPIIRSEGNHHGVIPEYIYIGGTAGIGHAFEPQTSRIVENSILFPSYALGYTFIESVYLGMKSLRGDNVVVGDPLLRIAYPCEPTILTVNTTISSGDYDCDIIVPEGITLTIAESSNVNFGRNVGLIISGNLNIESNVIVNFGTYSELRLEETAELFTASNVTINFFSNSVCTINNDFIFDGTINFSFNSSGALQLNGNVEIAEAFNLIVSGSTKCNVAGSLKLNSASRLTLNNSSILNVNGKMIINANAILNCNNNVNITHNNYGIIQFNSGSRLDINSWSNFNSFGKIYAFDGVVINENNTHMSSFRCTAGVLKLLGSFNNPVIINCPSQPYANQLFFTNLDTLLLSYTTINNGRIIFDVSDGLQKPRKYSISNSGIINSTFNSYFQATSPDNIDISLSDNYFSTTASNVNGLDFIGFNEVQFLRNSIIYSGSDAGQTGIRIFNNRFASIRESEIRGFNNGITQFRLAEDEVITESYEDIEIKNCTITGVSSTLGMGISIGYGDSQTSGAKIDVNNISNFNSGIVISQPIDFSLGITENTITDFGQYGISLNGGSEATVRGNNIFANESATENCIGISISQLNNPRILENNIYALGASNPGSGIILISANGEIRNNTIQNHHHGIELGSSSPFIGANTITDNLYYGMYISSDSHPDLSESWVGEERYPLSGYNTIRENGICNQINYSELYLSKSTVTLEKGCNTIADDREEPLNCGYYFLIDGKTNKIINAVRNYWGELNNHNPEGRFGPGIIVDYEGYLEEPCTYSESGGILILATSKGEVYDTIYATGDTPSEVTDLESRYATANEYYYNNNYTQAKQEYEGIIQNYGDSTGSLQAYNRLFTIANLTNSPPASFTQLKDFYSQNVSNQTDSIMIGTLTHLSDLCLVSAEEYITAINKFDEIAQQNPNTDIALYRQIDALTTSLLMPQDSSLNKGVLGKYSVSNLAEYNTKLSDLLKTRGKSGLNSDNEILPTEYTLYQNYPNPFNPTTTINYDLPNASDVSLIIYDILGRKVKELVNTKQQAGKYEVQFDASNLASGVYIYQLVTEKYMSSKKMILLR